MAAYLIDEDIRTLINASLVAESLTEVDREVLSGELNKNYISVSNLKLIDKYNKSSSILTVVRGKKLLFPDFIKTTFEVSEKQLKRRLYLQTKAEEKEYNRMIYGTELNPAAQEVLSVSNQMSSLKNQVSVGLNMIVAIFATFGMVYYISGQFTSNTATRLTYGLTGAVLIMMLEMVLFIMRAVQMESACEQRRQQGHSNLPVQQEVVNKKQKAN